MTVKINRIKRLNFTGVECVFNSMFTDIDECAMEGYCANGATCTNLEGGYNCDCVEGWTGDRCDEGLPHYSKESFISH